MDRRTFCARLAAGIAVTAGCAGDGPTPTTFSTPPTETPTPSPTPSPTAGSGAVEVAAGPEGRLRFVPEEVEIPVGGTVRWTFESPGHNVTSKPGASEKVRNPEGVEPFASYEGDQHFSVDPEGSTYEHTFTVPGEYVYVCAPHADQGMVGTVVVTEG
ncbi:plastocyanin/azurin family copper-binding protein [Halorarius halobius]|uniref:plastocyanin/azurin family copper-binding protein n=1 Tax=Halorarius halobius TaxID=2962671 RepID=UPI0020CCC9FB|nr:plastocyanin/azurin family copper-binding protein [Halorarius halobius]